MVKTNQFIDDDNLTESSSFTHLLDRNEDDDTEDIPVLKHSPFYSELQYNMFYQTGKCPGHSHCGLITYVHEMFRSEEVIIDQTATGWEHLTVQISHCKPN